MTTAAERRRAHTLFTEEILDLCRDNGTRHALTLGRGAPVEDCPGTVHRRLARLTYGLPARRAHYTLACLIALAGPPEPARPAHNDTGTSAVTAPRDDRSAATGPADTAPHTDGNRTDGDNDLYDSAHWWRRPNLGTTLALAVRRAHFNPSRTEELLDTLTRVGDDQLHRRLPALTERLLRKGLTPDWPVLLDDLADHRHNPGRVRLRWFDAHYTTLDALATKDSAR